MKYNLDVLKEKFAIPWHEDDKGRIRVSTISFINLLIFLMFGVADIFGNRSLVQITDNVVRIVDRHDIIQEVRNWLDELFRVETNIGVSKIDIEEALINKAQKLLDNSSLNFLPLINIKPHFDTEDECYLYFRNTVVKITENEVKLISYIELDSYVLKEQIIDRDFYLPKSDLDQLAPPYRKFISNISSGLEERVQSLESVIGYLLHRFQNPSKSKAIILLDENINELSAVMGGVGKSLFIKALSFVRVMCEISGKDFTSSSQFSFQRVTPYTNIVAINDVKANQEFEPFYGRITDGFTINRKYKNEVFVPFERSPKMLISSNYLLKAPSGNSTERRKYEFEFSNHYGKHLTVYDDFGHYFFTDWEQEEWDSFTFYIICCIQQYLSKGLIETSPINLNERRLISEVGVELIDFLNEELSSGKKKLHKKELFNAFKSGGYVLYRYMPTQRTFTTRLKKYFEYKDIQYVETPKNTKAYFEIVDDSEKSNLTTINDVKTDYKTVETSNMMTRLVNLMNEHFSHSNNSVLVVDLETTGLDPLADKIVCMALTFEKGTGYNIIFPKHKTKVLNFLEPLLPFLKNENITKVFHNAKFDLKFLYRYDIPIDRQIEDTMIMDYLLDSNHKTHGLKEISKLHLGYKQISFDEMRDGKPITEVDKEVLTKYACEDTDLTFQLYHFLNNQLNS